MHAYTCLKLLVFTGGGQTILSERSFSSFVQLCSLFPRSCYLCQTGIYRWSLSPSFGSSYVLSPCFVAPGGCNKRQTEKPFAEGLHTHATQRERTESITLPLLPPHLSRLPLHLSLSTPNPPPLSATSLSALTTGPPRCGAFVFSSTDNTCLPPLT